MTLLVHLSLRYGNTYTVISKVQVEREKEMNIHNKWIKYISIVVIVLTVLRLCVYSAISHTEIRKEMERKLQVALSYVDEEKYQEAKDILSEIEPYKDSAQLSLYCEYADLYKECDEYIGGEEKLESISIQYATEYQPEIDRLIDKVVRLKVEKEAEEEREIIAAYREKLPELGMSEQYIDCTKLGEPDRIEKCLNFEHLVPRARSKEYYWGNINNKESYFHVTVWYRRHWSNRVDDYTDYYDGNGYVYSISYYGADGRFHTESLSD